MSMNVRPDEDVKFTYTPQTKMSTNKITNVHNTIEMNIADLNSAEPKELDIVVEIEIVSRKFCGVVTSPKGDDSNNEECSDSEGNESSELDENPNFDSVYDKAMREHSKAIMASSEKEDIKAMREKNKMHKRFDKKLRVKRANVKSERQKKLDKALPGQMATFIRFTRFGKVHVCGIVRRLKNTLLNLVETSDPNIRKYVDFEDTAGKSQLINKIKDSHYALVYKPDDVDEWESIGIPRNTRTEFEHLIKSGYLPATRLKETCIGRVTLDIMSKGNTWDIDTKCEVSVKELIRKQRDEDFELMKSADDLMAEDEAALDAKEEEAYYQEEMQKFLALERERPERLSLFQIDVDIEVPVAQKKKQKQKKQKTSNTLSLAEFLAKMKAETDARMALNLCPMTQDKVKYPFGCCSSNCRFSGHPDGWNPKENMKRFKESKKAVETAQAIASKTVTNCSQCKFGSGCQRRDTCVFVHTGQLCRHGVDVCNGASCQHFEKYKVRRDK